jgi:prophage regulatory protein
MSELLDSLLARANVNKGHGESLLRLPKVKARTGKGTTTIYRDMANGTFPKPVQIGGGRVAWRESEIDAWIAARIEAAEPVTA